MHTTDPFISQEDYTDNLIYQAIQRLAALGMNTAGITKLMRNCIDPSEQLALLETLFRELSEAGQVTEYLLARYATAARINAEHENMIARECTNLLGELSAIMNDSQIPVLR
jgi:DNA-binding transcriptional MerR regulator